MLILDHHNRKYALVGKLLINKPIDRQPDKLDRRTDLRPWRINAARLTSRPKFSIMIIEMKLKIATISLMLAMLLTGPLQAATTVRYFQSDARYAYRTALLRLALEKTKATDGPYVLRPCKDAGQLATARGLLLVEKGAADVCSLPTTAELERRFIPVRIDILRGILGYRVFLINRERAADFKSVNSLAQLKRQFVAGFGAAWPDLTILKAGGLRVELVDVYESIFPMLALERFDYFPRGINEAWQEQQTWARRYPQLMVEEHLALYYPMSVYFFVGRHEPALAKRIERGLKLALPTDPSRPCSLNPTAQPFTKAGSRNAASSASRTRPCRLAPPRPTPAGG